MFAINSDQFFFDLQHIPFSLKYKYHKERNEIKSFSYDFRNKCYSAQNLKKDSVYKFIVKYKIEDQFIVVCKHSYFKRYGPKLRGVLTRQTRKFKKYYGSRCLQCCDRLILLPKPQWKLPLYKHSKFKRLFLNQTVLSSFYFFKYFSQTSLISGFQ